MATNILMPALSPTMEEGKLAKWLVKEGDTVKPGDVIAEIETDKATMEVEAVDEGVISKLVIPAGTEGVKVNALIAVIGGDAPPPAKSETKSNGKAKPAAKEAEAQTRADVEIGGGGCGPVLHGRTPFHSGRIWTTRLHRSMRGGRRLLTVWNFMTGCQKFQTVRCARTDTPDRRRKGGP